MFKYSKYNKVMEAANHFKNSAVEAENHEKHGARSKSLMSRENFVNKLKILLLVFILFPFSVNAQNEEISTLFSGNKKHSISGYGALETKFTQMDKSLGLLFGAKACAIFNSSFSIGLAGYGLLPTAKTAFDCPIPGHEIEKNNNYWSGGYGGLFLEYISASNRLLHLTANALIGCGRITYKNVNSFFNSNYFLDKRNFEHPSSIIFVLEPGVAIDLNMTKYSRLSFGVSYRYVPNFKLKYEDELVPDTFFNGFSANLVFKFGEF